MNVGMSMLFQAFGRQDTDAEIYRSEVALAVSAEELGYDSVWVPEHHFSDYSMSPDPMLLLSHLAGQTSRITLGSMVMVLPWHNPIRVAEAVSVVDNFSEGRLALGIGRGLARSEFEGLGADMAHSREYFQESAELILNALDTGFAEYDGEFVKQPRRELRPRPTRSFSDRCYGSAVSPESMSAMAKLGAGILIVPQKPWETVRTELANYRDEFRAVHDREAPKTIAVCHVYCDTDGVRARDVGRQKIMQYYYRVMKHYELGGQHFENTSGYDYYAKTAAYVNQNGGDDAANFYADLHVYGTPKECIEKIEWIREQVDCDSVLGFFSYSGMSAEEARANCALFASEVRPTLQRDAAFSS